MKIDGPALDRYYRITERTGRAADRIRVAEIDAHGHTLYARTLEQAEREEREARKGATP